MTFHLRKYIVAELKFTGYCLVTSAPSYAIKHQIGILVKFYLQCNKWLTLVRTILKSCNKIMTKPFSHAVP